MNHAWALVKSRKSECHPGAPDCHCCCMNSPAHKETPGGPKATSCQESAVPQQSSLTVLTHDCDASLKLTIRCGYGPLPTRAIWRSLLRPHYAGSGVASCPKPWVNAHRAVPGREAKYVLGDIGVKRPHIPWSPILPMRLLISVGATLPAATGKYARTLTSPSVMDQGWRRAKAVRGPAFIPNRQAW